MKKFSLFLILLFLLMIRSFSQTADVKAGCSPLNVQFKSDPMSMYYWDFVEGNATSTLQNPIHIFTHPGIYNVVLYEGKGGKKIGEIRIKVYEDPVINFEADTLSGCTPFPVSFVSDVTLDDDLTIIGYRWAFGDGEQSTEENPTHVYTIEGEFKVSLEIITDLTECNKIFTREKYIKTNALYIDFQVDPKYICAYNGKLKFTNKTVNEFGNQYFWDFGNGQTSTVYNPDSVYYDRMGEYTIVLTVTTKEGCVFTKEKSIKIEKPIFDIIAVDTGCINQSLKNLRTSVGFLNNTNADTTIWNFGDSVTLYEPLDTNFDIKPRVYFHTSGYKTISLRAFANEFCYSDTSFSIYIEDPDESFTIDPVESCVVPIKISMFANDTNHVRYDWRISSSDPVYISPTYNSSFIYKGYTKDSIAWNLPVGTFIYLTVTSKAGCRDSTVRVYYDAQPNAAFAPDIAQGCAPLEVTFSDSSGSIWPIVKYSYYYYNTGDSTLLFTDEDHSYTFDDPGEYYVKLIIENDLGCIDTSVGEWIKVGEPIPPEYELDKTEICLGDSIGVIFKNDDPRIDAFHLYTDDGRFSHCWKNKTASHIFDTEPGIFPVTAVTEYNGCYVVDSTSYTITVNGAKANIGYTIDCTLPNNVLFQSKSINASRLVWKTNNGIIGESSEFDHYFPNRGSYTVFLEAFDTTTITVCPPTIDSAEIQITNIKAVIDAPEKVCDYDVVVLRANQSVDVDDINCKQPYTWIGVSNRPVQTYSDTAKVVFPNGHNYVTLIVEDANGCKDTVTKDIRSFGIDLDIDFDKDTFCVPTTVQVINNSKSDTTLYWNWQNGSTEKEPLFEYDETYIYDYTNVDLRVKNAIGCQDSFFIQLHIYRPESRILLDPGKNICLGDELIFSATDFTDYGSHLNYTWYLGDLDTFYQKNNSFIFNKRGKYPLILHFEEDGSGCGADSSVMINVVNYPIANFVSDADSISPLCFPQIITFQDSSVIDGQGFVKWVFEDVFLSNRTKKTQVIEFPKGKHQAMLIAQSFYGCSDTLVKTYELVGPEGEVISDKSIICTGDTIEFKLVNPRDVYKFVWDFGDGKTKSNINPIKHVFNRAIETTDAKIVLKNNIGCEKSIDIPLTVYEVVADFEEMDTSVYCSGYAYLNNLSTGADKFIWNTPEGEMENEDNPVFIKYPGSGVYEITLIAINSLSKCKDEITKTITLEEFDNAYVIPTVFTPNGDGENDYFHPVIKDENFKGFVEFTTFKIYNRWGNLVYDNSNPSEGWDGTFNNVPAPAGVYAYYLEANISDCETIKKQGNVTLIR